MNYETDIAGRLAAGKDAATIASEINAERRLLTSNYRPIQSHQVAFWLASNGLETRMERGVAALPDGDTKDTLAAALKGVQAIRGNINASMDIAPGRDHRNLILAAIQASVMTAADLVAADAIAYTGTDVTAEQVTAAIAEHNSILSKWSRLYTLGDVYARANSEATLQQVFDAVVGDV